MEIQAFGPFAGREVIDFDELSSQGLFLLNGPTGAGKTSILDAVCFALYGSVPGARQQGKRLRSDHALPDAVPEVVCEFSARGRRLEVTRSPQWDRPSARSKKGSVPEKALTLLREKVDGTWVAKTWRNDEAGSELLALLGMSLDQFTKVVLLPQGDFAAFLRADAKERRPLLQRLFNTDRFETVEQLMAEEAQKARNSFDAAAAGVAQLRDRALDEARRYLAEEQLPAESLPVEEVIPALEGALADAVASASSSVESQRQQLLARNETIAAQEQSLADARQLQAMEKLAAEHEAAAPAYAEWTATLQAHRAAELLAAPLRHRDQAAKAVEQADKGFLESADAAQAHRLYPRFAADRPAPDNSGKELLEGISRQLSNELGRSRAMLPEAEGLAAAKAEQRRQEQRVGALRQQAEAASNRKREAEEHGGLLRQQLESLGREPLDPALLSEKLDQARQVRDAVIHYGNCLRRTEEARELRDRVNAEQLELKQRWLQLLERRLEQAAAELADTLTQGGPCPVCGGIEHPQPAVADHGGLVTREVENEARRRHAEAEARYAEAQQSCSALEQELAGLASRGGTTDPSEAQGDVRAAQDSLDAALAARRRLERLQEQVQSNAEQVQSLQRQLSQVVVEQASAESELQFARARIVELEHRLAEVLPEGERLEEWIAGLEQLERLVGTCSKLLVQREHAARALDSTEDEVAAAVEASEFDTEDDARVSLLAGPELDDLRRRRDAYEEAGQRLRLLCESSAVLRAQDAVRSGSGLPEPAQVEEARAEVRRLEDDLRRISVRHGMLQAAQEQLGGYRTRLQEQLVRLRPAAERFELVQSVADSVRGLGDNDRKMTLATYVLAARLEQIAAAASERLNAMTDGRYTLLHDDSKSGNKKSGLGLHVSDEWTGLRRDTSTLSGGESFMASLSLALGLADVVQAESGGVDIETLFVDEGFGSLDEQSLEQVMDALEGLRDGGRVVGLVSHVAEMKQRIGAQLQVAKGRQGSSVRTVVAAVE
ncbi:SMC domain-containing protein [Arthrobacter crystallopoietes BAB-32]|uniref:Nuclease SbcCD subunit C n=1 Tax=Arthrobacter crystallopoietes BAB-32 TaxID=1246476 RepID=N1V055_9MICC|nr:SMC domain-containing protein [Arthrobacter crystallopoietes BAB-32]